MSLFPDDPKYDRILRKPDDQWTEEDHKYVSERVLEYAAILREKRRPYEEADDINGWLQLLWSNRTYLHTKHGRSSLPHWKRQNIVRYWRRNRKTKTYKEIAEHFGMLEWTVAEIIRKSK